MGRIQSNIGLTTGIDIRSTITQLMSVSARPRQLLESRIQGLQSQQLAINELTALVIGMELQAARIGIASNVQSSSVSSSRPESLSATVSGKPTVGNYSVQVVQTSQTATASSSPIASATEKLQAGDFVVRTGGFVDGSASLDDLRGGLGVARGMIRIMDRSGQSKEIDLRFSSTIDDVVQAINSSGLRVNARTQNDRILLSDVSGQTNSNLVVEEVGGGTTAADLGLSAVNVASNTATGEVLAFIGSMTRLQSLRDNRGIAFGAGADLNLTLRDGTSISIDANESGVPTTVGQLLAKVNAIDPDKFELRISQNGQGFQLIDKTSGSETLTATGRLAEQLGLNQEVSDTDNIQGKRVQSSLQGPLLSTLQGGQGIGNPGLISITNRAGSTTEVDLAGSQTLRDVIDRINQSGGGVTAALNRSRTGIILQDVTGSTDGNLVIANGDANESATRLGIALDAPQNSVDSGSLRMQYVSETTSLNALNQGRGIRFGSFTLTNSNGETKTVSLSAETTKTVADVLEALSDATLQITARINADGDGIEIIDSAGGSESFQITDNANGKAALDLGIRSTGTPGEEPGTSRITGSQTFRLSVTGSEDVNELVSKINDSNGPITASLLTSATGTVRLLFTSRASGLAGRVFAEGESIGLNVSSTGIGRDAIISVGGSATSGGTLISSSDNSIRDAIPGVSLELKEPTTSPVSISVTTGSKSLVQNLQLFVDQYNKVRDKIKKDTDYDANTKSAGILIGSSEILRVEQALSRLVNQRTFSSGSVQSLQQLGVSLNDRGQMVFDEQKLQRELARNPQDVTDFLTKAETGFGDRAKRVFDGLAGVNGSTLLTRSNSLQRQIELKKARIESIDLRLEREKERLEKMFFNLELNISKIRNNGSGLNQIQNLFSDFSNRGGR
jgi:flagellar hook-associated protein 2